jgi:hypothetical protein
VWAEEARRRPECNPNGKARFILTCVLAIIMIDSPDAPEKKR